MSVHCGQGNSGRFWVDQLALAYPPEPLNWVRSSRPQVCISLLFRSVEPNVTGSCVVLTTPCTKTSADVMGSTAHRCEFSRVSRNLSRNVFPSTHACCASRCVSMVEHYTSSLLTRPPSVLTPWTRMPLGLSLICICLVSPVALRSSALTPMQQLDPLCVTALVLSHLSRNLTTACFSVPCCPPIIWLRLPMLSTGVLSEEDHQCHRRPCARFLRASTLVGICRSAF